MADYIPPDLGDNWNLDGLSIDHKDLSQLAYYLDILGSYARNKSQAMRFRAIGYVKKAQDREDICEAIYRNLPKNWKW